MTINKQLTNILTVQILDKDIFAFWALDYLFYNYEINRLLIANTLLNFLKFYIVIKNIRRINLQAFCCKFIKLIFNKVIKADFIDNFIYFGRSKKMSTSFLDNYYFKKPKLVLFFFYNYQKTNIIVNYTFNIERDIVFNHNYLTKKIKFNSLWR